MSSYINECRNNNNEPNYSTTYTVTFYTSLDIENGYGPVTCTGEPLQSGIVANNKIPLGTSIVLEGYGEVVVADRGGSNFNNSYRLDMFIDRLDGESDKEYYRRVNSYGIVKVKGYIKE